jgi:hypothetical protein
MSLQKINNAHKELVLAEISDRASSKIHGDNLTYDSPSPQPYELGGLRRNANSDRINQWD